MADLIIAGILGAVWIPVLAIQAFSGRSWIDIGTVVAVAVFVGITVDRWIAPWGMVVVVVLNVALFVAAFLVQRAAHKMPPVPTKSRSSGN